jgi:hypothetical protein
MWQPGFVLILGLSPFLALSRWDQGESLASISACGDHFGLTQNDRKGQGCEEKA